MKKEFEIVANSDKTIFEAAIVEYQKKGWELSGSMIVVRDGSDATGFAIWMYFQAFTK